MKPMVWSPLGDSAQTAPGMPTAIAITKPIHQRAVMTPAVRGSVMIDSSLRE
ncbi:hypothetical protein [Microbacterium sp. bgisy207]|uniref:hypothetical protein n=1 Tax=Microbacterium sp. bgisy207 TaxID=3413800 RepID=UPI003EBCBE77